MPSISPESTWNASRTMQRSSSPGTAKPLTAQGHVTLQLQFSKYVPDSCQLTAPSSRAHHREIKSDPSRHAPSSARVAGRREANPMPGVVDVPLQVPDLGGVLGLGGRRRVPRADDELAGSRLDLEVCCPEPPAARAGSIQELGRQEGLALVERHLDALDAARPTGDRVAART